MILQKKCYTNSGSFGIDFSVIQDVAASIIALFSTDDITAVVNIITLLGLSNSDHIGLIKFLKLLRNRPIEKIDEVDKRNVRIQITRTEIVEIDKSVLDLYKSPRIRRALENAIAKPLEKDGIDRVITSSDEINKSEIEISKIRKGVL